MPTLILPPRITPDTDAIFAAAQAAGWEALRLDSWRIPAGLNGRYAAEIAQSWNARDAASGQIGHVTRFRVRAEHLARYVVQVAGATHHQEYWFPAEELDAFNDAIVGPIEVIATYQGAEDSG